MDVWGPYHDAIYKGERYFLTVVDDFSRATWVFLMKQTGEVVDHIRNFLLFVKNQFDKRILTIRTDNGLEFCNKSFYWLVKAFFMKALVVSYTSTEWSGGKEA